MKKQQQPLEVQVLIFTECPVIHVLTNRVLARPEYPRYSHIQHLFQPEKQFKLILGLFSLKGVQRVSHVWYSCSDVLIYLLDSADVDEVLEAAVKVVEKNFGSPRVATKRLEDVKVSSPFHFMDPRCIIRGG